MDIEEIKKLQKEMDKKIVEILNVFHMTTGLKVNAVHSGKRGIGIDEDPSYWVETDVRLS